MDARMVLTPEGLEVCSALGQSALARSFYLAGGTGLAVQLGHRKSDDLDFFPRQPADRIPATSIAREIERLFGTARARMDLREAGQVTWAIMGIKTSFIGYPFPLLHPPVDAGAILPELKGISLAHPRDIAAMKAYALGRRATARDYVDLYFLLQSGMVTLDGIISDATAKFVIEGERVFSTKLFLEQMCYSRDLEDADAPLRLVNHPCLTVDAVGAFLRHQVKCYLERQTGAPASTT